jgi:hypothetical protein
VKKQLASWLHIDFAEIRLISVSECISSESRGKQLKDIASRSTLIEPKRLASFYNAKDASVDCTITLMKYPSSVPKNLNRGVSYLYKEAII